MSTLERKPEMSDETTISLETKSLSGGYGKVPILHGIEFGVTENEVVGILGHNGMGKITLLKTLMGFLPQSRALFVLTRRISLAFRLMNARDLVWGMCPKVGGFFRNFRSGKIYALLGMNIRVTTNSKLWKRY